MCIFLFNFSYLFLLWMSAIACSVQKESPAGEQYLLDNEIEGISVASFTSGNSVRQ